MNAARGSIVDTQALLSVIDSGRIKGAALDTYEYESYYVKQLIIILYLYTS